MRRRARAGTSIRTAWDVKRIGKAIAAQGTDLRHWVSYGTVASVGGDGGPDFTDADAVVITPAGIDVDVILEPSNHPVTCRWGVQAGAVFICTPIHPGDQVVVIIPEGDTSMVPEIVKIIPGSSDPIPTGEDGLPVFKNDRALIFSKGVPIDLRTDGGSQLLVNPDGTVVMNAGTKGVARLGDAVSRTLSSPDLSAIAASLVAAGQLLAGTPVSPPSPVILQGDAKISSASETVKAGD